MFALAAGSVEAFLHYRNKLARTRLCVYFFVSVPCWTVSQ